jgi:hypothetical protein
MDATVLACFSLRFSLQCMSAFKQADRNKTAAMSGCIAR